jgi:hypothetical protein
MSLDYDLAMLDSPEAGRLTGADPVAADIAAAEAGQRWLEHGLATGPGDRAAAEQAVRDAYRLAGLTAPTHVVWLGSPLAGACAAALLNTPAPAAALTGPWRDAAARLAEQGCPPGFPAGRSVRPAVRTAPWAAARRELTDALGPAGWARHWAAAGRRPWQLLVDRLATPLRTRLEQHLDEAATRSTDPATTTLIGHTRTVLLDAVHGQLDGGWLGAFDSMLTRTPRLAALADVARGAGWWWPYERVAILTERPEALHRDNVGRLHHGDGPALCYPDGYGLHAWRGMPISGEVAAALPRLTVEQIRAEDNAEIRRVMLEHFGFDRYLAESQAVKVGADETGILWRVDLPGDEPLVMVEVINSTPEPDGESRVYFLRVPPATRSAREGVAWTFGLTAAEYAPLAQT